VKIENLSKELNTEELAAVQGGLALTGQVVPTSVQSNELAQKFNVASCEPVAVGNSADQSNYSAQTTFSPVGSVFVIPPPCVD